MGIKTPREWKNIIGRLSPEHFEQLCHKLVKAMPGFVGVDPRDGSSDGGRDIDATYNGRAPDGITEIREKWRFECKKYSAGISFDDISGKIHQANLNRIDKIVIMSNMHLTPACKDEIDRTRTTVYCKIIDWTGVHFQDILFQRRDIFKEFFPDEEPPQITFDMERPQELITSTQRVGSNFGIILEIKLKEGQTPPTNIDEVAEIIKERLINLKTIDFNIKSLIYQQVSGLFLSIDRKDDALLFIRESIKITPNNIAALLNEGFILEKMDDLKGSNRCYDNILKLDDKNKFALNNKASNLKRLGDFKNALNIIDKALEIDGNFTIAINNRALILDDLGKAEDALDFLESKLKDNPTSKILLQSKVNILIELLDLKEAMNVNEQILKMDPNTIDAINAKGVIYEHNARYQKPESYIPLAIDCFEKVTNKDENYPLGWANKIACLLKTTTPAIDIEVLVDTMEQKFPTNSYILDRKGQILLKKGNARPALKYFNKALKYNCLDRILINKARALLRLHRNEDVIDTLGSILKYDEENSDALRLMGEALEKLHQVARAKYFFKKAANCVKTPKSLLE